MRVHFGSLSRVLMVLTLATAGFGSNAFATSIVFQNTTTPVGSGFLFNGAAAIGSNLATNIDINELSLASGSPGDDILSLSFLAANFNAASVEARPTVYVWAANGAGGAPGTLLDQFSLPLTNLASGTADLLSVTVPPGSLIVPSNDEIWAGIGFDNDNGLSGITAAQLNNLGGLTYHPATIGIDGPNAYFLVPGLALDNPAVTPFGSPSAANYGWTVTASPVPEPATLTLTALGLAGVLRRYRNRRSH